MHLIEIETKLRKDRVIQWTIERMRRSRYMACGRNKVVDKQGVLWYDCTIKI